jgi:predicted urease superfamily metal-dependent hydrolase
MLTKGNENYLYLVTDSFNMSQKGAKDTDNRDHVNIGIYPADRKKLSYIQLDLDLRSPKEVIHHLLETYDRKTGRMKEQKSEPGATIIEVP